MDLALEVSYGFFQANGQFISILSTEVLNIPEQPQFSGWRHGGSF
jgi:hypothetical protein